MFKKITMWLWMSVGVLVGLSSCSSSGQEKKAKEQEKKDSVSLVYDPKKADKELDAYFKKLHERSGFNGNVLIAKKGKVIYKNSMGWADYLHRDSLALQSQFELASVSKPLTATAILLLKEQGKIRL